MFRALYPELLPKRIGKWSSECLTVNRDAIHPEGTFEAAGTGTSITSRHYDVVIEDDTVAPELAGMTGIVQQPTRLEIDKAIGFHKLVYPLLLHPSKSQIVVIGTRWAEYDLLGYLEENFPDFVSIDRRAREGGVAIWDRFNEEVLKELEVTHGKYMFAMLYMNTPTAAVNQVFDRDWIRYYQNIPRDRENQDLIYITSVDPASAERSESSDPDYTVVITTAIRATTGDIFVVRYDRERMNPSKTIDTIFMHNHMYHPVVVRLDGISYQRTLGFWLEKRQRKTKTNFYVDVVTSYKNSKEDRIRGLQPYFQAKQIGIRTEMTELERELLAFPKGRHDDIIDALSLHIKCWNETTGSYQVAKSRENIDNIFSGAAIIAELESKAKRFDIYPYDVGLMSERLRRNACA